MNIKTVLHIENKKILKTRKVCLVLCLVMGLIASMILSFYHSTDSLFQYNLGYTTLRLTSIFFSGVIACSSAFDKIGKHLKWLK